MLGVHVFSPTCTEIYTKSCIRARNIFLQFFCSCMSGRGSIFSVTQLDGIRDHHPDDPYSYRYGDFMHYTLPGDLPSWHQVFDDMPSFVWRPYLGCDAWLEDSDHLVYCLQTLWLLGRSHLVLESYLPNRLCHQFGER